MGIRCADHVTPLYPQKLALTSPTGGVRSVGIVRSRTKATEFFFLYLLHRFWDIRNVATVHDQTCPRVRFVCKEILYIRFELLLDTELKLRIS